jgi:Cation efflux family
MVVQMGYGVYTNSLGLVSDSIHMLVDCAAIAFGLGVSVLADEDVLEGVEGVERVLEGPLEEFGKHSQCEDENHDHDHGHHHEHNDHDHDHGHSHGHNHTHSHDHTHNHSHSHSYSHSHDHGHTHHHHHHPKVTGKWAKLEDLAGFANGVFLVFVCLSILSEALGRLIWPEEVVEVEQLLIVSILGLCVNLVGVFSFNHGYVSPSYLLSLTLTFHGISWHSGI